MVKGRLVNCENPQCGISQVKTEIVAHIYGEFSKQFLTDVPADVESDIYHHYKSIIPKFPEEGVYIYSFEEGRMIFALGWEDVIGLPDDQLSMLHVVNMTAPEHADFVHDINDAGMKFLTEKTEDLEQYSFTIEIRVLHQNGNPVPVTARVGVFEAVGHKATKIIGRFQINRGLRFGKVMRYSAYGPEVDKFEEELSDALFSTNYITRKEKEALSLASKGFAFKEIADKLDVSQSAIEKRILPLYKRFNLRSLPHLVSFAYENHILPD